MKKIAALVYLNAIWWKFDRPTYYHIVQGGPKTDTQFYFWDNFGNSAPILTILSLLHA